MTTTANPGYKIELPITLRLAQKEDLPKLEWFGQYAHFRRVFQRNFRDQEAGKRFMLIADCNGFPIGQVFAQIVRSDASESLIAVHEFQPVAYYYSLRVMDMFRGQGIGSRLLSEAESRSRDLGCIRASIAAAKDNRQARRLYERAGYVVVGEDAGNWNYTDQYGRLRQVHEPCYILEKYL